MMKTSRCSLEIVFILVLLSLITTTVYANAGSGLFFPGIIQLLIGNVIIGLIEAFFVRKALKIPVRYWMIILANYASMIFGYFAVSVTFPDNAGTFYTPAFAAKMLPILFVASVLIEWPFFSSAVKDRTLGFSKTSLKYTFYAQCVSYVLLVPFYFLPMFDERPSARDFVEMDLNNLAAHAYQYRIRPASMGGGEGSYRGYAISEKYLQNENGCYAAISSKDSIVFVAMSIDSTRTIVSVVVDSTGMLRSWKWTGEIQ